MKTTPQSRSALRALEAKATRGEWTHDADDSASIKTDCATVERRDEENGPDEVCTCSCADARLIAAARNALPGLLDDLDEAERDNEAWQIKYWRDVAENPGRELEAEVSLLRRLESAARIERNRNPDSMTLELENALKAIDAYRKRKEQP